MDGEDIPWLAVVGLLLRLCRESKLNGIGKCGFINFYKREEASEVRAARHQLAVTSHSASKPTSD